MDPISFKFVETGQTTGTCMHLDLKDLPLDAKVQKSKLLSYVQKFAGETTYMFKIERRRNFVKISPALTGCVKQTSDQTYIQI